MIGIDYLSRLYQRHGFALGITLIGAAIFFIGWWVLLDLRWANGATRQKYADSVRDLDLLGELQYQTQEARRLMLYSLTTNDPNRQIKYADEARAADVQVAHLIEDHLKSVTAKAEEQAVRQLAQDWQLYLTTRDEVMSLILAGDIRAGVERDLREGAPLFERARDDLKKIKAQYKSEAQLQITEDANSARYSFIRMMVVLCLTLILAGVIILTLQRRMLAAVRRKAEQLREAINFTEAVISHAGEGIVVYDREMKFKALNKLMAESLGVTVEQVQGKYAYDVFPFLKEQGIDEYHRRALSGEMITSHDLFAELPNGKTAWRSATYAPLRNADGEIIGIIGTVRDITARKKTEAELRAFTARLEQSNRELQDFALVASHDLQEPLRKIQAFGDRLQTKYREQLGETGLDYLARMQNAASRMQTLINDLLSFSRVTTRAKPFEPIDLERIAHEVVSDLEIRIEQTSGRVEIEALPIIDADPVQMRQLFQNLIGNALKFHKPDEAPVVRVNGSLINGDAGVCEIIVTDNGIGFDEKYLDRIFTIFQRLHGRSEYEGTGVGLAVCRKIAERHGGTITAKSQPQQGTTFIITLPASQPNPARLN